MDLQPAEHSAIDQTPAPVPLRRTPLHAWHERRGGRLVPFAGYAMPVQYASGLLKEHLHTRASAGLFDVSHMGQFVLRPADRAAEALERLIPADIVGLAPGRQRYGLMTDEGGGIRDDLMVARLADRLLLVVNAANKAADAAYLRAHLPGDVEMEPLPNALVALQGPRAEAALARLAPAVAAMRFMDVREVVILGRPAFVARSGYTGEDGFEISLPGEIVEALADALTEDGTVLPVGLGARDSLRLEAGLCLHGADIDRDSSPVEAALSWAIPSVRRRGGTRAGGFPGAERILAEIEAGSARRRVGLIAEGRAPVRAGAPLYATDDGGSPIGTVTSGGFGPSRDGPVAMGYLPVALAKPGTRVFAEVRGRRLPLGVSPLPFVPAGFKRA